MTRPTRTLLLVGVISLGGVVSLAIIAERYGEVLQTQADRSSPPPTVEELPDADAARFVTSFVDIRTRLRQVYDESDSQAGIEQLRPALDEAFARGLIDNDIDRVAYQEMDSVYRAWLDGRDDVPSAFRTELDRYRETLSALEIEGYDPLGLR